MKIVIALASSSGQMSGVQRHALNLASCLLTRPEISAVHLVAAPWQQSFIAHAELSHDPRLHRHAALIGNTALSRNLWFYRGLPSLANRLDADIVHLAYPAPLHRRAFACPVVVTLHDLYPYDIPENFGFPKVLFNRAVLRQCLSQADAIACVSASTLARLKSLDARLAYKKASVLYNSVPSMASPAAQEPLEFVPGFNAQHPFLLCVAQHRRNKNILLVLRALESLLLQSQLPAHTRLLIIGIPGPETQAIESFIANRNLARHVLLLNGVQEQQLQWFYRHCSVLLAPSIVEGFGLPVTEGLLAGCPVVCSDIAAFRELASPSCHFVPLGAREQENFAAAIQAALQQPRPQPVDLPQFSVPAIGAQCVELYRSLRAESSSANREPRSPLNPPKESQVRL